MVKKLDIERTRAALQNFEFGELFREELGWSSPKSTQAKTETVKEIAFSRKAVAELSGAVVFEISLSDGSLPDSKQRKEISKFIRELHYENVCIFVDKDRSQSIWHWEKKQDKKMMPRDHFYMRGQPGDLFIAKLSSLVIDLSDFDKEGNIPIAEVASRMKAALDVEVVTKKFYKSYQEEFNGFLEFIEGIEDENDRKWYASVILNRLMFIYFLQRKFFLDNGDADYLSTKLEHSKKHLGKNKYYNIFLKALFFEGFAKEEKNRSKETIDLIGKIKYLNGGLFLQHKIEKKYNGKIKIADIAFENLLTLFKSYSWNLNDTPGGQDNELNPDVLGYIFEKYINQKAFGAYYTRTEITEYLCEQTVYKLILDGINGPVVDEELLKKSKIPAKKRYERIEDLLIDLDAEKCRKLIVDDTSILPNLSLLDPACGSGAFLVAAMKTLINVYAAVLGKIEFLGDKKLKAWLDGIKANHPSVNYYIKKQIITNNLYGVDIMEEASEIAKLRLFLALVASAQKVDDLEPLPNIDFNIMSGNSLIGLMRVDENAYNQHQKGDMFKKSYAQLVQEREAAIRAFKSFDGDRDVLQSKKESIDRLEAEANQTLNLVLGQEFHNLGIKYEQQTWDGKKEDIGKALKRNITVKDIEKLTPFHWGYEFSEIFRKKDGFDAIITNPPWEVFQTDEKEFFHQFDSNIKKKKLRIEDWKKKMADLMTDEEVRNAWLNFASKYPFQSSYFKRASQYMKLLSGKLNLYTLFTIQCYNLLKNKGYCGIVIPSGIYSDLGATGLRKLIFEKCKITSIFSFENKNEIFEGVHRSFKFSVLSFEKGKKTTSFPAAFMRHDVTELSSFPQFGSAAITLDFIKQQSPDSYSVMEMKNEFDFSIAQKMLRFPFLSEKIEGVYNVELYSEYNMTTDSHLFRNKSGDGLLPLYEGKMIGQFSHTNAEPRYWIKESEGREALSSKTDDPGQTLDYQGYRIGFRDIARSTDSRTMISSIIPKNSFAGNTLSLVRDTNLSSDKLLIVGLLNSFVNDYAIRQKVSAHCNFFYVYQLRIPRLKPTERWYKSIVEIAAKLVCVSREFAELWENVMQTKWDAANAATNESERINLIGDLDGIVAHIYGLDEREFAYVLSTFPIVKQDQKVAAMKSFKDIASQFQTATFPAANNLFELIKKGEHKNLEYKSTLLWDIKENARKYHIEHSVLKTIAAFLNSDGGTLLIGVTDDGQIHGLEDDFKALGSKGDPRDNFNKAFDNLISNNFGKSIHRLVHLSLEQIDGKYVAKVEVKAKAPEEVFLVNKEKNSVEEFYIRLNASSVVLTGKDLTKYIKEHWKS